MKTSNLFFFGIIKKTSNLTTTHHSSISSYALKLTKFSKSVGIRTLHVQKRLGQNYLELIIAHGFYFVDPRLKKKKKKSSLLLSLIKLINFKILLVVNIFFFYENFFLKRFLTYAVRF